MSKSNDVCVDHKGIEMPIGTLLQLIPDFDTKNNNDIYRYIRSCDAAFNLATITQQPTVLVFALNKITGPYSADVHAKQFLNWAELKTFLIQKFSQTKTLAHLNLELQSMFQKHNESITEYYHRVELCRSKIIEKLNAEILDNTLLGRLATTEETALNVFINGISSDIGTMLRTKGFNNLSESGRFALQEDKIRAMNNARQTLFRTNSPRLSIAPHKPPVSTNLPTRRPMTYPPHRPLNNQLNSTHENTKICNYCKHPGHVISECRKRTYNNNLRNKNQLAQPTPSTNVNNLNLLATNEVGNSSGIAICPETSELIENLNDLQL
ncbi:PREDICTED: uncharacterized protein LOC106116653 [Papilio xuthus]|uniref:Uncharacterized protein LOC106116653 n=1 Tax=Papilio xuthus TaxID=66420 RepID=A0AAJ6Z5Y4_PAPXU|nr:PREDICTED: uncharacterized protein LOC106116653 [Papilio xuthus]